MPSSPAATCEVPMIDHRSAFDLAPVGLVLSRQRLMLDCNLALAAMFRAPHEALIGQSLRVLYPSPDEFERTGTRIARHAHGPSLNVEEHPQRTRKRLA